MNAAQIKARYAARLKEPITVRRYTGTGANRPHFEVTVRGKATQEGATQLIGTVAELDWTVFVLVEDMIAKGFTLPLTTNDKVVVGGKELAIIDPKTRKAADGTLIVYVVRAR